MRLPRGVCSVCDQTVALRRNGVTREHRDSRRHRPSMAPKCKGSGKAARLTDAELQRR